MNKVESLKDRALARISVIVHHSLQQNIVYKKLAKDKIIEIFDKLLDNVTPEKIILLNDEELTDRIEGVLAIEAMSHLLDDLTTEQKEIFFEFVGDS